jgi:hypothetical protein
MATSTIGYVAQFFDRSSLSPADGTEYYLGVDGISVGPDSASVPPTHYSLLATSRVRAASLVITRTGTAPSGEAIQVRLSRRAHTANEVLQNIDIATGLSAGAGPVHDVFSDDDINWSLTPGESLHFKITTPTWVTNPTGLEFMGWVLIEQNAADARVIANTTHAGSAGTDHSDVVLANTHRADTAGADHSALVADVGTPVGASNAADIAANLAAITAIDPDVGGVTIPPGNTIITLQELVDRLNEAGLLKNVAGT